MVVILLLTPYATNGCDGGTIGPGPGPAAEEEKSSSSSSSNNSNNTTASSTTSTGDTAIPSASFQPTIVPLGPLPPAYTANRAFLRSQKQQQAPHSATPNSSHNLSRTTFRARYANTPTHTPTPPTPPTTTSNTNASNAKAAPPSWHYYVAPSGGGGGDTTCSPSPPPPPLPKSKPPYESYYRNRSGRDASPRLLRPNAVPKPPRQNSGVSVGGAGAAWLKTKAVPQQQRSSITPEKPPLVGRAAATAAALPKSQQQPQPKQPKPHHLHQQQHRPPAKHSKTKNSKTNFSTNFCSSSNDFVRHVTRVNFYDIDTSQVEFLEPKDADDVDVDCVANVDKNCDTEAITKEEEWITKRKTELTTTRQIETRVKRQVVLEDGKVVEDSGPIVSTNTTEDTDKQETETTEKRDLGIPQDGQNINANAAAAALEDHVDGQVADYAGGGKLVKKMVTRPADGLVRESNDKRVVSHEEIKDYLETEDRHHLGDFSDETYVKAVNSGAENLQEILLSAENQKQLVPLGPRIVANTSKSRKTIDSEDTLKRSLAQADGKIVTESKKTTEHEVIVDEELPEKDDQSTGSREKITTVEATQRYYKQRDEQNVDLIVDGKVVGTEMRYAAETMQVEKDGSLDRPGDWDSLSDRMRKLRRPPQPKTLLQQHKEAALLADRKDALTKRPLDFDREEETRKGETMKWLESHFGSESTASNDSRDDDVNGGEVEPTKKTYFNVTIKSNQPQTASDKKYLKEGGELASPHVAAGGPTAGRSKYYQGITNWTERKDAPANHFASKAFREDLQETVERNRLRKGSNGGGIAKSSSRDKLNEGRYLVEPKSNDNYVSREDILHQKRQSLSSQFLAKSRRSSRDHLEHLEQAPAANSMNTLLQREAGARQMSGSRTDLRYGLPSTQDEIKRVGGVGYSRLNSNEHNGHDMIGGVGRSQIAGYNVANTPAARNDIRAKSYERELNDHQRYETRNANTLRHPSKLRRTPSPDEVVHLQTSTLGRPTVPQRRRAIEKKLLRQQSSISPPPLNVPLEHLHHQRRGDLAEPPPDYSPPPRSRSSSPQIDYIRRSPRETSVPITSNTTSTLTRKQNQRTRFAPTTPSSISTTTTTYHPTSAAKLRPVAMATQTTQTTPSTISNSTAASHKSSSKVGQVIGNSLRKLVSKIRSASAERKLRMKSKSKSREQSPSPQTVLDKQQGTSSYQQYNVIDSHIIGGHPQPVSPDSELDSQIAAPPPPLQSHKLDGNLYSNAAVFEQRAAGSHHHQHQQLPEAAGDFKRADSADPYAREDRDERDQGPSPRQRYYLGEDPYSSTLYGKENIYDPKSIAKRLRNTRDSIDSSYNMQRNNREAPGMQKRDEDAMLYSQRNTSSNTLGRYQKSGQRFAGSTPNLNQDYRTTQTLPRKLNDHHHYPQQHQQQQQYQRAATQRFGHSNTLGHPDRRSNVNVNASATATHYQQQPSPPSQPTHNSGPAKPARTYAKVLNRSKSFNVHGMNGSNDPSPIYIEKLTKNNYNNNNYNNNNSSLHASQAYKSNPHLYSSSSSKENNASSSLLQSGLKSPSIVNLISRSQKDLSKLGLSVDNDDDDADEQRDLYHGEHGGYSSNNHSNGSRAHLQRDEKKQIFLKGLHQQAPDLYKTLHGGSGGGAGDEDYHHSHPAPAAAAHHHHHTKYQLQPKHSLDSSSRSPIELNKDTASIVRRGSTSTNEDYVTSSTSYNYARASELAQNKRILMYKDDQTTRRRGSGSTIIEVRNIDSRK